MSDSLIIHLRYSRNDEKRYVVEVGGKIYKTLDELEDISRKLAEYISEEKRKAKNAINRSEALKLLNDLTSVNLSGSERFEAFCRLKDFFMKLEEDSQGIKGSRLLDFIRFNSNASDEEKRIAIMRLKELINLLLPKVH